MSFTDEVKHELVRYECESDREREAELAALMRRAGSIILEDGKTAFQMQFNYADLSRRIYSWLQGKYNLDVEVLVQEKPPLQNHNRYELYLPEQSRLQELLKNLGLFNEKGEPDFYMDEEFCRDQEEGSAYLRGFFLACGSVNHPSSQYHLEFRCDHKAQAEDLTLLLFSFSLYAGFTEHKNMYNVYLKNFESISALLNLMGARQAQLKLENAKIVSGLKEDVNRRVNFETANLDRTVEAAMDQIEAINIIEREIGLNELSSGLREMAELRKKHPYDSLKELGERLEPPLSKSGVNNRLRRIKDIARKIGNGE